MKNYKVIVYTEIHPTVLNTIILALNYRNVDISTINQEESIIEGINKYTLDITSENKNMPNVIRQVEKYVYVLKAYLLNSIDEVISEEKEKKLLKNYIN